MRTHFTFALRQATELVFRLTLILVSLGIFASAPTSAHQLTLEMAGARAVLDAVQNPRLTIQQARSIAGLPANKGLIRKVTSYGEAASEERFAEELVAAARGKAPEGNPLFSFVTVKNNSSAIEKTLRNVEAERDATNRWLQERVQSFSPAGPPLQLQGFLVLGTDRSSGFAFGGNDFYLNVAEFAGDEGALKVILAHELYHAVVGAARKPLRDDPKSYNDAELAQIPKQERRKYLVELYLSSLLAEGVGTYVGDPQLLVGEGQVSREERERFQAHVQRIGRVASLLDVSLVALTADQPISYEKAYGVGFYMPSQPLYYLGYVMAKAVAEKSGSKRLGELAIGTGCGFAREYLKLSDADPSLQKLGGDTRRIVFSYCP